MLASMKKYGSYLKSSFLWIYFLLVLVLFSIPFLTACLAGRIWDPRKNWPHKIAGAWGMFLVRFFPLWKVSIEGRECLEAPGPFVFVCTHQSIADIVPLCGLGVPFRFVAKQELFKVPLIGWAMRLAGYIGVRRGDEQSRKECVETARGCLRAGISVLFFPEGTRSADGQIQPFRWGPFRLAVEERVPVVPVVISGTRSLIRKGSWVFEEKARIALSIGKPVETRRLSGEEDAARLCDSIRAEMTERFERLNQKSQHGV